jgi:hypothetical protein
MATEMGEYLVGSYLKLVLGCGVVDYNTRPPGGGMQGLGELDVVGFDFAHRKAYFCEVTTHLGGLLIGPNADNTIAKLKSKHARQRDYVKNHLHLPKFAIRFMFWSPVVRRGLVGTLAKTGFELFINQTYSEAIEEVKKKARTSTADANNPAFRVLQILEHMRRVPPNEMRSAVKG